jgi:hypothetical protein
MRQYVVLRHALAQIVSLANAILRICVPLLCGLLEPLCGLNAIPWQPLPRGVHHSKIVLSIGAPAIRSQAVPLHRRGVVLRHKTALGVQVAEVELGGGEVAD